MDDLDLRILGELQVDGRRSYREIGKHLGVTAATVRTRVLQLMEEEVVEVVAMPNPWRMGFGFFAVVGLRLSPAHAEEVADVLAAREEVTWVGMCVTGYEVMCELALEDAPEFGRYREDVLARLPGYQSAEVFLLSDVRKLRYRVGSASDSEARSERVSADAGEEPANEVG